MKRLFLFAVVLSIVCVANAQTRLIGRVVTAEQQAIEGATITLVNQEYSTTTNDEGRFSLTNLMRSYTETKHQKHST